MLGDHACQEARSARGLAQGSRLVGFAETALDAVGTDIVDIVDIVGIVDIVDIVGIVGIVSIVPRAGGGLRR
jgi:hypothetical protein